MANKTTYDNIFGKDDGSFYRAHKYASLVDGFKKGQVPVDALKNEAIEFLKESALETSVGEHAYDPVIKDVAESDDPKKPISYINSAQEIHGKRLQYAFEKDLENLVTTTPNEVIDGIESLLPGFRPKKDVQGTYEEAAKLHYEIYGMNKAMSILKNEKAPMERKKKAQENIAKFVSSYFEKLHSNDPKKKEEYEGLVETIKQWAEFGTPLFMGIYQSLMSENIEKFNKLVKGNIPSYLVEAMPWRNVRRLYFNHFQNKAEEEQEKLEEKREAGDID